VQVQAGIVEHAVVRGVEIAPRRIDDCRGDLDQIQAFPGVGGQRAERGSRTEADHQRAVESIHEDRRIVREEALRVHLPTGVALEFAVRVQRVHPFGEGNGRHASFGVLTNTHDLGARLGRLEIHVRAVGELTQIPARRYDRHRGRDPDAAESCLFQAAASPG
jgi:hypothetical protein